MADGIDAKVFSARLKTLPAIERQAMWDSFWQWYHAGVKVSRPWTVPGILLVGAAGIAAIAWSFGDRQVGLVLFMMPTSVVGVILFVVGARKEKRWRLSNPFEN
jgi:hypothetical protein